MSMGNITLISAVLSRRHRPKVWPTERPFKINQARGSSANEPSYFAVRCSGFGGRNYPTCIYTIVIIRRHSIINSGEHLFSHKSGSPIQSQWIRWHGVPGLGKRSGTSRSRAYVRMDISPQSSGCSETTRKPRASMLRPDGGSTEPRVKTGSRSAMTTNCSGLSSHQPVDNAFIPAPDLLPVLVLPALHALARVDTSVSQIRT
jgi:hypothetical protein